MYNSYLDMVARRRSDYVTDLDIPDYVPLSPYYYRSWNDPYFLDTEYSPLSKRYRSSSSLALSRAMTDSDIDYDWYHRYKTRLYANSWDALTTASTRFPYLYLDSLRRYYLPPVSEEVRNLEDRYWLRNEELLRRMRRYLDEECRVYQLDDPALSALEDALNSLDLKVKSWKSILYSGIKY